MAEIDSLFISSRWPVILKICKMIANSCFHVWSQISAVFRYAKSTKYYFLIITQQMIIRMMWTKLNLGQEVWTNLRFVFRRVRIMVLGEAIRYMEGLCYHGCFLPTQIDKSASSLLQSNVTAQSNPAWSKLGLCLRSALLIERTRARPPTSSNKLLPTTFCSSNSEWGGAC